MKTAIDKMFEQLPQKNPVLAKFEVVLEKTSDGDAVVKLTANGTLRAQKKIDMANIKSEDSAYVKALEDAIKAIGEDLTKSEK